MSSANYSPYRNFSILLLSAACGLVFIGASPALADTFREAYERGKTQESNNDDEGAINSYVIAASLAPNAANDARISLARIYARIGRYAEAESEWQQILSSSSKNVSLQYEYGQFLTNEGKFNSAMSVWSDILGQNPNDQTALYFMGLCLEATDNIDSSQGYYQKAVSLGAHSQFGALAYGKLARLGKATDARASSKFFPVDPDLGAAGLGWWNLLSMPIHVYIDDGSGMTGYRNEMKLYVSKALDAWHQASNGKISFVIDPPDPRGEQGWVQLFGKDTDAGRRFGMTRTMPDDPVRTQIHVHWTQNLAGALGLTWTSPLANPIDANGMRDCLITHGHIWLHTNSMADGTPLPKLSAANSSILDKQDRIMSEVTVHEFGHMLGLLHSPNPKDVMCSGIFAMNSSDLVEGRTLSLGDLGSLSEHYNRFEGTGFPASANSAPDATGTATVGGERTIVSSSTPGAGSNPNAKNFSGPFLLVKPIPKVVVDVNNIMFDINSKHFADGLAKLDKRLQSEPDNSWAHYLRAVVYVMMHKYKEASADYNEVIKLEHGSELAKRASEGLKKINSH